MRKKARNTLPDLKSWIQANQITVINSLVTIVLIGIVIFVLLNRANALQKITIQESLVNLSGVAASEVQANILSEIDSVRSVSQMIAGYQTINITSRRDYIDDILREALSSTRSITRIFSIWKPDELDGRDELFVNTRGSDETGNYINGFSRERGWVEQRTFGENRFALDLEFKSESGYFAELIGDLRPVNMPVSITNLNIRSDRGSGARPGLARVLTNVNTFVVDVWFPIANQEMEVVAVVGVSVNLYPIQQLSASRKPMETGSMVVCSYDGTIIGHPQDTLHGTDILKSGIFDGISILISEEMTQAGLGERLFSYVYDSVYDMESCVFETRSAMTIITPIRTTSTLTLTSTEGSIDTPPWFLVTQVPMATIMAPIYVLLRFSVVFIVSAGILMVFILLGTSRSVTQRARNLQNSLQQASTMQDNLKYGLFLMDEQLVIQGAYSKALEKILSIPGLQGKNFVQLLSVSLKDRERNGFTDYLNMIFKRSFDEQMLESINPISEFDYFNAENGEKKTLRSSFKLASVGRDSNFILGTLEDITAEKELMMQLKESESHMEKEMRSLFQVLQLNPRVLSDFIEDTEYEFTNINDLLKRKEQVNKKIMFEVYQSVHAVKSNALILNLEAFSVRVHNLESSIKTLQEKYEDAVPFDDLLSLILEIDEVLNEKDQLKAAISKIEDYRRMRAESGSQETYVLVETLTQLCQKLQSALDKKIRLVVENIDEVALDHGPRRIIKEVLTQLVRNAVYHGIEHQAERESLGKEPEGEIRLSIKHRDNQIIIKLTDNGRGIDFNRVREIAIANKLIRNPADANDKNQLLKIVFMPGFSTLEKADMHGGRGVGLSLVKDRIKGLLGNIAVSTKAGKGTTFTIAIPMELPVFADKKDT